MEAYNYKYYSSDQLEIESIDSKLSNEEKRIRRYLMNYTINNGQAFQIGDIGKIQRDLKGMRRKEVVETLDGLLRKNVIVADNGNVDLNKDSDWSGNC